ncbi:PREDICTED: isopentenyl-diphosphate Delta-isomerase 1 isoform X1 [Wasmannia auropunctata]|uniref:isopentenyl-diphosphate Delta-isomerase 1 isoform X1 n=2 Tax=Wasmannia auropunctata TaxID=64793 RepID=UPI0005EDE8B9|nr:PREDICTED: isopentenyl-diphosphate Delta-isomerase 1 isoform X1 [Wasmannia auropunctata]
MGTHALLFRPYSCVVSTCRVTRHSLTGDWPVLIRREYNKFNSVAHKMSTLMEKDYGTAQIAPLQKAALQERCILVDKQDRPVGEATKQACHEIDTEGCVPLHRAFSVYLFNSKGELLLQKRSNTKITFPNHYTNTCCSHPLAEIPNEKEEEDAIGVRRAAIRRLNYELGIPTSEVKPADLFYLTRIRYQAPSNNRWGEHEIDYILFLQRDNLTINPNPDEVSETRWVPRSEIDNFMKTTSLLTPWFRLIYKFKLLHWWDNLHGLAKLVDHQNIPMLTD